MSRPAPDDFIKQRQTLGGQWKLAAHYRVSHRTVARWIAELGLPDLRQSEAHRARARLRMPPNGSPTVARLHSYSAHDNAADTLRRHTPVYRCDERGRADPKGSHWRVGNTVVDGDELLARADRARRAWA